MMTQRDTDLIVWNKMTNQPQWKLVAQLGDVDPISYGGYFIYEDETGVYAPEAEHLESPDEDADDGWIVHRFSLDRCTLTTFDAGEDTGFSYTVLSDNSFHPEMSAWFAPSAVKRRERPQDSHLGNVADTMDTTVDELQAAFCADDVRARAWAYRCIGDYYGYDNLDAYPLRLNRADVEARYAGVA